MDEFSSQTLSTIRRTSLLNYSSDLMLYVIGVLKLSTDNDYVMS